MTVYLHVGVPKTGTTFVQDVLWRSRGALARSGVCYPLRRRSEHFAAAMDVRRASWGGQRNPAWDGTWQRLARAVAESGASVAVISSELLAAADPAAVDRAVRAFPDHDVHVVLTARDLARQLVSGWQEQVKHRVALPLDDFVAGCLDPEAAGERARRLAERFWQLHDLPDVAGRWGAAVAADRVHLVTVPPAGAEHGLLWERFASVVGVDIALGRVDTARPNSSLGAAEAELLRRYNQAFGNDVSPLHYDQVVRVLLAEKVLTGSDTPGLVLSSRFTRAVQERSRALVEVLAVRGYDVVGELGDLVPAGADGAGQRSAAAVSVGPGQLADAGVRAVAGLVAELGPLQRRLKARRRAERDVDDGGSDPPAAVAAQPPPLQPARPLHQSAAGPVYLHVGAPKTGTTFLQDLMWHHRDALAAAGVLFARRRYNDHYRASLDLRAGSDRTADTAGAWDRVAAEAQAWTGTAVISHELFAAARPPHVERALDSLGPDRVHVVYTVRDLWRMLGAEWQEATKHGRALSFETYLDDVLDQGRTGDVGRWFWSVHDPVDVLARWGAALPPERVHVVTLPPAGADPGLLWERFASVIGVDPTVVDPTRARPNTSLGAEEVTLLRHVNARLGGRRDGVLAVGDYGRFVKDLLAQDILSARPHKTRYAPSLVRFDQVQARAETIVGGLGRAGYPIVGDLGDLVPPRPREPVADPDDTTDDELVAVGLDALAGLVRRAARMREQQGVGVRTTEPAAGDGAGARAGGRVRRLLRRAREGSQS